MRRLALYIKSENGSEILGHRMYYKESNGVVYDVPRCVLKISQHSSVYNVELRRPCIAVYINLCVDKNAELVLTASIHMAHYTLIYTTTEHSNTMQINGSLSMTMPTLSKGTILYIKRWISCIMRYALFERASCIKPPHLKMCTRVSSNDVQDAEDCLQEALLSAVHDE
jgi:hypothetical protein